MKYETRTSMVIIMLFLLFCLSSMCKRRKQQILQRQDMEYIQEPLIVEEKPYKYDLDFYCDLTEFEDIDEDSYLLGEENSQSCATEI